MMIRTGTSVASHAFHDHHDHEHNHEHNHHQEYHHHDHQDWHKRCFACASCNRHLDSTTVNDGPDGEIYCRGCHRCDNDGDVDDDGDDVEDGGDDVEDGGDDVEDGGDDDDDDDVYSCPQREIWSHRLWVWAGGRHTSVCE